MSQAQGVILSLLTAMLWALSPLLMASVARRIGSLRVAALRSIAATVIVIVVVAVYLLLVPGARRVPPMASVAWLAVSSVCGMVLGDLAGYEAFVLLGPRRVTQVGMLAPVFSVLGAWVFLDERLSGAAIIAIAIVLVTTAMAALAGASVQQRDPGSVSARGLAMALLSAVGTGLGAVAVRYAFAVAGKTTPLDALVAAAIRIAISALCLGGVLVVRRDRQAVAAFFKDSRILARFVAGVSAGATLGMICYVTALSLAPAGIVSALSSTSPLFILPMVWYRYKARIGWRVFAATSAGCAGVAWLCLPGVTAQEILASLMRLVGR